MATFELTWQHDISRPTWDYSSVLNLSRSILWGIKAFLKGEVGGATGGLWTCYGSSDSVTAGLDGTDRWGSSFTASKIVRGGTPRSWIVLKSPDSLGPIYMIWDVAGPTDYQFVNITYCKAAPTGGTINARPSSTFEWSHPATLQLNNNTASYTMLHCNLATNGDFIVAASRWGSGFAHLALGCFELKETYTSDLFPYACYASYGAASSSNPFLYSVFSSSTTGLWASADINGTSTMIGMKPLYPSTSAGYALADITASGDVANLEFPDFPIYMMNRDVGYVSLRGRLPDLRWAPAILAEGSVSPIVGSIDSMILGDVWLPSDVAPVL